MEYECMHAALQHFCVDIQILLRVVVRCAGGPSGHWYRLS